MGFKKVFTELLDNLSIFFSRDQRKLFKNFNEDLRKLLGHSSLTLADSSKALKIFLTPETFLMDIYGCNLCPSFALRQSYIILTLIPRSAVILHSVFA